jgi:DNA-binding IscR family transcriptional regulator
MVASSFPSIIGRQRAGWRLARDPHEITLLEVYDAVEQEPLFAMHHSEPNLTCVVPECAHDCVESHHMFDVFVPPVA